MLCSGPSIFNRHIVMLNTFDVNVVSSEIVLVHAPFWIQCTTYGIEAATRLIGAFFVGFIGWNRSQVNHFMPGFRIR